MPNPNPPPAIENLVEALGILLFYYVAAPNSLKFFANMLFFAYRFVNFAFLTPFSNYWLLMELIFTVGTYLKEFLCDLEL